MDILLEKVSDKSFLLIKILKLFKKNIYFLKIDSKNDKKLFFKLKSINVRPLPVENVNDIPYDVYCNMDFDPKNLILKKANSIYSKKISKLFLKDISNNSEKTVKLLIKDVIGGTFAELNSYIELWLKKKKFRLLEEQRLEHISPPNVHRHGSVVRNFDPHV